MAISADNPLGQFQDAVAAREKTMNAVIEARTDEALAEAVQAYASATHAVALFWPASESGMPAEVDPEVAERARLATESLTIIADDIGGVPPDARPEPA